MSEGFAAASTIEPSGEGVFRWEVPDGWQQGRGAFGGLVLGAVVRTMEAVTNDSARALRCLHAEIMAPVVVGATEIRVEVLRRGSGVTFVDARMTQQGGLVARASGMLAAARKSATPTIEWTAPVLPPWTGVEPLPIRPPLGPVFAHHFLHRNVGPMIFSGGTEPLVQGWIAEAVPPAQMDAASLVGLMDAWWPSVFSVESIPRAASTVTFAMEFLVDPASLPVSEPLIYTSRTEGARDGYTVEFRELWSGSQPVALNQQTFAMLG